MKRNIFAILMMLTGSLVKLGGEPVAADAWPGVIEGKNLALGREVILSPTPLFRLTTNGEETRKLTDGKWKDETLPHSKNAVGWGYLNGLVYMIFDLGEEVPVGKVVARFQGGEGDPSILLPRKVSIALSRDGRHYFEAASLTKVTGGESELAQADPERYFYLPETGTYFVHPFIFALERKARYVALEVTPGRNNIFSDEVFIMASTAPEACRGLEGLPKKSIISKGIEVRPKSGDALYISTGGVVTPNFFTITDMRPPTQREEPVKVIMDLPPGIDVRMGWKGTASREKGQQEGSNRWVIEGLWDAQKPDWSGAEGPVYFLPSGEIAEGATATFSTDEKDSAGQEVNVPVRGLVIPRVSGLTDVHVSLTWMSERDHAYSYPRFFESFAHCGFTGIGTFPRNSKGEEAKARLAAFADEVRSHGLQVVYNESAFNVMEKLFARHSEIFHQIDGKPGKHLCPTYTGTYYQKEIERVRDHARLVKPDVVFHDTELWYRGVAERRECTRCQEAYRASGFKDFGAFMLTQGTRMTRDLHDAVAGTRADGGNPLAGNYNVVADPPTYHQIYEFAALYPEYFDFAMPVLYVLGNLPRIHDTIRANYQALGKRDIIPWMTAGTYGEFPPHKVEQMILETLLNGARGLTYYRFQDHDPLDYYHQAVALNYLVPHQKLLKEGRLLEAGAAEDSLYVTAWGDEKEALLLVGHYAEPSPGAAALETSVSLKGREIAKARPLKSAPGGAQEPGAFRIAPGEQFLWYVRFR